MRCDRGRACRIWSMLRGVCTTLLLCGVLLLLATSVTPIYDFAPSTPFCGSDIYNPYAATDSSTLWRRANLHAHTRVEGMFNECDHSSEELLEQYHYFDYDIVGITNHNEITAYPDDAVWRVPMYEHGYNLRNFHNNVIGAKAVELYDAPFPLFTSQLQWQLDRLSSQCDILQVNHPSRTPILTPSRLERLTAYRIMELTGTMANHENEYWDCALTAGRYSFGMLGDDTHDLNNPLRFATRCCFVAVAELSEDDILRALHDGCFYSMRVPNYGRGDIEAKRERNRNIPRIRSIGMTGDTIYLTLTQPAERLRIVGSNHRTLLCELGGDSIGYRMRAEDVYARFIISYPDSLIIMSNPFARYDAATQRSPFDRELCSVNIAYTILYNTMLLLIAVGCVVIYLKLLRRWRVRT